MESTASFLFGKERWWFAYTHCLKLENYRSFWLVREEAEFTASLFWTKIINFKGKKRHIKVFWESVNIVKILLYWKNKTISISRRPVTLGWQNDERRVLIEQEILNQFNSVDMTEVDLEMDLNLS